MNKPALSVILCAHNPRESSITRVLHALAAQTLPRDQWELLLIDNASSPPLAERALPFPANSRIEIERELGLTPARMAGFAKAAADVFVMIDDDTVPEPTYLEAGLRLMQEHPEIGAAGGRIRGEFGAPLQHWMSGFIDLLAIRDFGDKPIRALVYNEVGPWEPCGAGMILRSSVAAAYVERSNTEARRKLDRVGTSLSSCGDTDLARTAPDLGMYTAYEPQLSLTHLIPAGRLELRYLARLAYCVQRDGWLLYRLRGRSCSLSGWRLWAHTALVPLKTVSLDPRRWLMRAASSLGQLRGRSLPLPTNLG